MPYVTVHAPTKINLRLKVVGRREDGYHFLSMLNEKLTLTDKLHVSTVGGTTPYQEDFPIEVACPRDPSLATDKNLVVKAARRLAKAANVSTPVKIVIDKHIPIGAGLGGGSSDAAACLKALNRLWGLNWGAEELSKVGLTIGADVPFFFCEGPARVTGIGEEVDTEVRLPKLWILLINPGFEVSTREVYESLDLELTGRSENDKFPAIFKDLADLSKVVENDLEVPVLRNHQEVDEIKRYLVAHGAEIVFMSGSGPTVVGLFKNKNSRDMATLGEKKPNWKSFSTENFWHRR